MFLFVADELLSMLNHFPVKLAFVIALSCANPALGQSIPLRPVEQTVEDVSGLSTSFRYVEPGLLQPSGFDQVYRYSGRTDFFVRIDGATLAVFPESVYVPSNNGLVAAVPAGTIYYIGDQLLQSTLNGNIPQTSQPEGLNPDSSSGRLMWRVQPELESTTQSSMKRTIGTRTLPFVKTFETDKETMSRLRESDAPDIVANSTYRKDRIRNLMKIAAEAAKHRGDESGST